MTETTADAERQAQVLQAFEQALDQPPSQRRAWLAEQRLPAWLHERVLRLLDTETALGGFLEQPAIPPELLQPEPAVATIGDRLGAYELLRQIDAGGMGVVFLARRADRAYEQQVAIKLIRPLHLGSAPEFRRRLIARFENERALLARLQHPNIARIVDGGSTAAGVPYLVMEYVDGVSLTRYCETRNLDVRARLALFRKVCDGVQEAHRHLIVHRDLKPENILVDAGGEPRLLDFGIARRLEEMSPETGETATSLTAMTPAYASPEQVRHEPLTTASDVYSLGVVLYRLLADVRPYELAGLTPAQAERVVCDERVPSLREALQGAALGEPERRRRQAQLGGDLQRIVDQAMHKDVARRYASAQQLGADVQRYLDGEPVLAHPDSTFYRTAKFVGRHRWASATATLALAGIVVAAGIALWQAQQARRAADDMRQINAFLLDVLKLSDPFDAGEELTLSQALDEAAQTLGERFPQRPDLSADIRFGIGYSMVSRARLDAAEIQLTTALSEAERAFGADDIRTLRILEGIAGLRQEQGRADEAERAFVQAIERVERAGQQRDALYLALLSNLGNFYLTEERYEDADRWLRRALQQFETGSEGGAPTDHALLLGNLAQADHGLLRYDSADALYRQSTQELEALFPEGSPDVAIMLGNHAMLIEERGGLRDALPLYERSLTVRRRVFRGDHPMVVTGMVNLARKQVQLGEVQPALVLLDEAIPMADRVYTDPNSRHASAYVTLAEARLASGDEAAAQQAWLRGRELLARFDEPTPSVAAYLERVRVSLCERSGTACPAN